MRDTALGHTVRVFEPANTRSDLVSGVASRIARPTLVALPVLALLVWFSIGWSLAPLKTLSGAIRARDINRLEPVDIGRVPTEVRPLVDAINLVLSRLRHSLERERAFTADAAHELKSPLAAIKVQAQVALAEPDTALQRLAMERVVQGVDRSARLAEQLLLLARLDVHERLSSAPLKPAAVAKDALLANERNAQQKNIRVTLTGDMRAEINAEPVLIGILLDNLLDNAIKYGRAGGCIEVAIQHEVGRSAALPCATTAPVSRPAISRASRTGSSARPALRPPAAGWGSRSSRESPSILVRVCISARGSKSTASRWRCRFPLMRARIEGVALAPR